MNPDVAPQILETLREIRDGQREIAALLATQQKRAEEQLNASQAAVAESVGLQKLALQRQRHATVFALPAIGLCVAAIVYLVWRYF